MIINVQTFRNGSHDTCTCTGQYVHTHALVTMVDDAPEEFVTEITGSWLCVGSQLKCVAIPTDL